MRTLALLLMAVALASAVSGVDTLSCSAISSPDLFDLYAGDTKVLAVATEDGVTTCLRGPTNDAGDAQQFALSDPATIPVGATVDSVVTLISVRTTSVDDKGQFRAGIVLGANTTESATLTAPGDSIVVRWGVGRNNHARPGGGSYSVGDCSNIEMYVKAMSSSAWHYVTYMKTLVYWTGSAAAEPTGDFFIFD
jgi:hypothetical protein